MKIKLNGNLNTIEQFNKIFGSGLLLNEDGQHYFHITNPSGVVGLINNEEWDEKIDFVMFDLHSIPKDKIYASYGNVYYLLEYIKKVKKLINPYQFGLYYYKKNEPILCLANHEDIIAIAPVVITPPENLVIPFESLFKERPSSPLVI